MASERNPALSVGIPGLSSQTQGSYLATTVLFTVVVSICLLYMTIITVLADVRGTVKDCEKLLIYNVIVPDTVVCLYIFGVICPAIHINDWAWGARSSQWLGFVHLCCLFHPYLAMANICNIITFSVKNVYSYEGINTWKHLTALVLAYASLSVCFCSLPVVEAHGLDYKPQWFTPMMTVSKGFGGIFQFTSYLGIILTIESKSLMDLLEVKKLFKQEKVPMKVKADLKSFLSFVYWSLTLNALLFISLVEMESVSVTFGLRLALYSGPIWRIVLLTQRCPHFNFNARPGQVDLEELAMIGAIAEA